MPLERLNAEDARILTLESPTIAGHTCKTVIAARPPGVDDLVAALRVSVAARVGRVPRVRQRLAPTPLHLGPPAWVDDPDFDVARHIDRVPAEAPVSDGALRELIAARFALRLPRDRPLWRIDVVEGLDGGRVAYLVFLHHAMADGTAALRIGAALLWDEEPGPPPLDSNGWTPQPAPGAAALLADAAADRVRAAGHAARTLRRDLRQPGRLRRPSPRVLVRALRPEGEDSPLDVPIGSHRGVAFVRAKLEDFKRVRAAAGEGTTVNDVVLAAIAGALRTWLGHRGIAVPHIRVKVPVSMHPGDEEPSAVGNRDSFFFADLPVAEPDPRERLAAVRRETARRKQEGDADALYLFFSDLAHVSRAIERRVERLTISPHSFALCVSNVPGPRGPRWVLGGEVEMFYSLAEVAQRHGLRVAVFSFCGEMSFGLCADADALPDLDVLATGLDDAIAELVALA
jgi:diacylglycerol O-acyltransferase / wax synthase